LCGLGRATIVAGHRIDDPAHVLEHALHAPKAAAGEDEGFRSGVLWHLIEQGRRQAPVEVGASRGCVTEGTARQTARVMTAAAGHNLLTFRMNFRSIFQADLKVSATPFMQ
jgi:hypothetical protein